MKKFKLLTFLIILTFFLNHLYSEENKISKVFLKYNRDNAIAYASKYWNEINDKEYYNFGGPVVDPFTKKVLDSRDCWYYNKQIPIDPNSYTCGGDCANFISQCLIAGGLDSKLFTNGATNVVINKNGEFTIVTAISLRDQLSALGAYDNDANPVYKEGLKGRLSHLDLLPGDIAIGWEGDAAHSSLIGTTGANGDEIGIYCHSNANCPTSMNFNGAIDVFSNYRLIHIPEIPMVERVEIYGAEEDFRHIYKAVFTDSCNSGNGGIQVIIPEGQSEKCKENNSLTLLTSKKLEQKYYYINMWFTKKIQDKEKIIVLFKSLDNKKQEKYVKVEYEETKAGRINGDLWLGKFKYDNTFISDLGNEFYLHIGNVRSESDGSILNSVGNYSDYKPGADTNHRFGFTPEMHVENMEIDWLHVNPENKPFPT